MVILSAQVGFEGTYGQILVYKLLLYGVVLVLAVFWERPIGFRTTSHFSHLVRNVDFRPQKVIRLLLMTGRTYLQYNISCCH